jgi:aromatic ring-opening dioxygenase catalytic subunit (LigB family)
VGKIARDPHAAPAQSDGLHATWQAMQDELYALELDALIVVSSDHYETFGLANYPIMCLGVADEYRAWGEFGNPSGTWAGNMALSEALLSGLIAREFDVSRSLEMNLDHGFNVPLTKLLREPGIPIIPLFINCNTPPLPSFRRAFALGEAIADTVAAMPDSVRVGIVGTGGLSHWVGVPGAGNINEEFDREFLALLESGDVAGVTALTDAYVMDTAGNGALEIRAWVVAQGASGGAPARILSYEAMRPWHTGIGMVRFEVGAEKGAVR